MARQNYLSLSALILSIGLFSAVTCKAQNATFEFWPEADIWYRLSPAWRLSVFVPVTKYYESKNRDVNIFLQADYAWGKTRRQFYTRMVDQNKMQQLKGWLTRGGYMQGWSLGEEAGEYTENMVFGEIHKRVPLLGNYLLSQRIRSDLRWLGDDDIFSYRFRYRLMVEKEFASDFISVIPYFSAEPFWDSRYATFNRVRLIGGSTFSRGPKFALESNITYQYDEYYSTSGLLAFNLIVHLYFETVKSRLQSQIY